MLPMGNHLVDNNEKDEMIHLFLDIHSKYSVFCPTDQFSAQVGLLNWCKLQPHKAIFDKMGMGSCSPHSRAYTLAQPSVSPKL